MGVRKFISGNLGFLWALLADPAPLGTAHGRRGQLGCLALCCWCASLVDLAPLAAAAAGTAPVNHGRLLVLLNAAPRPHFAAAFDLCSPECKGNEGHRCTIGPGTFPINADQAFVLGDPVDVALPSQTPRLQCPQDG